MADRLTILALKLLIGKEQGKPTDHFRNERNALITQLNTRETCGPWLEHLFELSAVNAALWHAEDDLRELRAESLGVTTLRAGTLAFRIQELNDQRAALVGLINEKAGDGTTQEKLT
jgi:hypothetical protein